MPALTSLRIRIALVAVLLIGRSALGAQPETHWYALAIDGAPSGWSSTRSTGPGAWGANSGEVVTETETKLTLRRDKDVVTIHYRTSFTETPEGRALRAQRVELSGDQAETTTFTFTDGAIRIEEERGWETAVREIGAHDGAWLTPGAAREYVARRLAAGAGEINYRTVDLSIGVAPIPVSISVGERTEIEAMGQRVAVTQCEASYNTPPVHVTEWITPEGVLVRSETAMGGLTLTRELTTREEALRAAEGPDLIGLTLIKPDRPIAGARGTKRASYVLRAGEDGGKLSLAACGAQRVEQLENGSVRVTVDLDGPAEEGEAAAALLEATAHIDFDDAGVRELAGRAPDGLEERELARRLRRIAHGHITTTSLDVGFARASEVARTRRGDCTEHAVLLAALLRARGIPSRVVSGLIYAPSFAGERGVFAFHMWTQALVDDGAGTKRWIDLDATLGRRDFDAAHIAIAASALGEDGGLSAVAMPVARLLGRLSIEVESIE